MIVRKCLSGLLAATVALGSLDPASAASRNKPAKAEQAPIADDTPLDTLKDTPPAPVLACQGPFARTASHTDLVAAFGEKNVVFKSIDGEADKATVVFENDPVKQIVVHWRNMSSRSGIASVTAAAPSTWVGPGGIRNGLPLKEVEKLSGGAFNINGFEANGGGLTSGLKGRLIDLPGGCNLSVRFEPGIANPLPKKFSAIVGDRKVSSSDKLMRRAKPMVSEWSIGYN